MACSRVVPLCPLLASLWVSASGGQEYEQITKKEKKVKPELWLNLAVCYFYLGMYQEAKEVGVLTVRPAWLLMPEH